MKSDYRRMYEADFRIDEDGAFCVSVVTRNPDVAHTLVVLLKQISDDNIQLVREAMEREDAGR